MDWVYCQKHECCHEAHTSYKCEPEDHHELQATDRQAAVAEAKGLNLLPVDWA